MEGTGACGINCLTCKLYIDGKCSPCGAGLSQQAHLKLAAQQSLLGGACPILECAIESNVFFCLRDCPDFPCEKFQQGPYPYSTGFLQMQARRREQPKPKTN